MDFSGLRYAQTNLCEELSFGRRRRAKQVRDMGEVGMGREMDYGEWEGTLLLLNKPKSTWYDAKRS